MKGSVDDTALDLARVRYEELMAEYKKVVASGKHDRLLLARLREAGSAWRTMLKRRY